MPGLHELLRCRAVRVHGYGTMSVTTLFFHFTVTHEKETACTCAADLSWVSDRCRMAPFLDALRYKFSSSESIVRVSRASASMSPWSPFHLHSAAPMFEVLSCFPCVPPKILEPWSHCKGRGIFHSRGNTRMTG